MYKSRKFKRNANVESAEGGGDSRKRPLNTIDENTTIKITRPLDLEDVAPSKSHDAPLVDIFNSEEENVPASQEPTQRYLSQRSVIAATLTRTQSRNATHRPPSTYFELVLMKAGVQLDDSENFVLSCDHVGFVGRFREILVKCQNYPDNIKTFQTGLRDALRVNSKYVHKLLSGCTISAPGEEVVYQSQDSMLGNFLMIDFLRDHVLEVLLDKIDEIAGNDTTTHLTNGNIPLLPLLLAQLRSVTLSHGELVFARIKDILDRPGQGSAKLDIIANAEFMIPSKKHDEFVEVLLNITAESKDFFQNVTIQTLTNLSLSSKLQSRLRCKVLAYIKDNNCPPAMLPVLVRFLLQMCNEKNDELVIELVNTLREIVMWHTSAGEATATSNTKQSQLELFHYIAQRLTCSKKLYTIWQKKISSLEASEFSSFDFIMLLLLIHIKEDNYMYIENILRRRIKHEEVNIDILSECKTKYAAILEQYTSILMQILHDFLKEKAKAVADFARASYGIIFQICESIQKNILRKLLELTFDKSAQNMTNLALELLRDLQRKHPAAIQNWGMLLMPLLDRLNEMSLSQTRLVMQLLCSIAYPAPTFADCPALQDQIDMLVKKQIINRTALVKKQGIIGSVQLIDSIARVEGTSLEIDEFNTTFNTVSDLPDGRGKIAANYVARIFSSTMHCPELLALFYDELASVCAAAPHDCDSRGFHDKPFLIWLCELITYYFQNSFVAEHSPETTFGIQLSYQKCINSIEDAGDQESELPSIAINIAELVLRPTTEASSSIIVLAPIFNLLRVVHLQRHQGSLEQINALLGCAIILPTFFDESNADRIFGDYDENVQKKILDIYFHCVNWIRETVSSFSTQRENIIRKKVLQRLGDLIDIEHKIRKLLCRAPSDYMPPMCQFLTTSVSSSGTTKSGARGRPAQAANTSHRSKTAKFNQSESEDLFLVAANANTTHHGNVTLRGAAGGKNKNSNASAQDNFACLYGPREIYRPMGSDIMLILNEKLSTEYPLPPTEVGKCIGLREFRFILSDMVSKLESITGVQKFHSEETLQYIAKPHYYISDLAQFLTVITSNMDKITNEMNGRLEKVEHNYGHSQLFTEEFNYLKVCLGLCLRLFAAYFSWSEFIDTSKSDLLKESLSAILAKGMSQEIRKKSVDLSFLAGEVFKKFITYAATIVDLKAAVHLYQLVETLKRLAGASGAGTKANVEGLGTEIRTLCKSLLCRKWFNYDGSLEKGALCNIYLNELVKGFLKDSDFNRQLTIISNLLEECKLLGRKDSALPSFPNFKKANFPILFRGLCEILIGVLSKFINTKENRASEKEKFKVWEKSCRLLNMLLEIVQTVNIPRNFQSFSKYAHMYLKLVLQHGLPVYEQCIRQYPEKVSELLKDLQITTRFLHNLCCHSKALRNTVIVSQIPFLRETVETLVFRVKALLTANKCASVFCMANLKNKDLHGDLILSQTAPALPESDEEIPDDDESVDETIVDKDESTFGVNSRTNSDRSKSSSRSKCF